jgi:ribosomal protein S18 acetylase RimI-like enzyme
MRRIMEAKRIRSAIGRFGLLPALGSVALRALHRIAGFRVLQVLVLERPNPEFLRCPAGFGSAFLTPAMLADAVAGPEFDLAADFLAGAAAKGDLCVALLDADGLAAYTWYSRRATAIDCPDLVLRFDPRYVYMYKGFTHPRFRGRRLYPVAVTQALQFWRERGFQGLLCYVEAHNLSSRRSAEITGWHKAGSIVLFCLRGRNFIFHGGGCRAAGVSVGPQASPTDLGDKPRGKERAA